MFPGCPCFSRVNAQGGLVILDIPTVLLMLTTQDQDSSTSPDSEYMSPSKDMKVSLSTRNLKCCSLYVNSILYIYGPRMTFLVTNHNT